MTDYSGILIQCGAHLKRFEPARTMSLLFAMICLVPSTVSGQARVGMKGGLQVGDTEFESAFQSTTLLHGVGGGFLVLPLRGRLHLQLEGLWTGKGFSTTGLYERGTTARMRFIEFPVLLRFRVTTNWSRVRPFVYAGGFYGHEVSCNAEGGVPDFEDLEETCEGRFRFRRLADLGLIGGFLLEMDVGERWFAVLDARYTRGMVDVQWDPESQGNHTLALTGFAGIGVRLN